MEKISFLAKILLLPVAYFISSLTYTLVLNMFGIEMVAPGRVESFLLICAVVLTTSMVWGGLLVALNRVRERSS